MGKTILIILILASKYREFTSSDLIGFILIGFAVVPIGGGVLLFICRQRAAKKYGAERATEMVREKAEISARREQRYTRVTKGGDVL